MTCGRLLDLGRQPVGDLAAEVHGDDVVGDAHHQAHVVLDQQGAEAEVGSQPHDQLAQVVHLGVGEAAGRLVEQQQARAAHQRPGQLDPLQRAERQPAGRAERDVGQVELAEQVPGLGLELAPVAMRGRPADRGRQQVRRDREWAPTIVFCMTVSDGKRARFWKVRATPFLTIWWRRSASMSSRRS